MVLSMKTDLDIIEELEIEIEKKLPRGRGDLFKRCGCVIDKKNNVVGLNLENIGLYTFPSVIKKLDNLEILRIALNSISQLPPEIKSLRSLKKLYLGGNKLRELPPEIGNLKGLQLLSLSGNYLSSLPTEIANLKNLRKLSLRNNLFISLPVEIAELDNLQSLDLRNNKLTQLPKEIVKLRHIENLSLDHNPLEIPPIEIVKRGTDAILAYFRSFDKSEKLPLNEVKVLFVGDGGAGKTSLVKQLCEGGFDEHEPQTHGINVRDLKIEIEDKTIYAHLWDFGGQEIMHATHQFFLSKRSLYVLVLDGRREEKTEYWLKLIESFGGNSPIIVVLNKIDQNPAFDVNRLHLQREYKGIKGFYRVSCANGKGINAFATGLREGLANVELLQTIWSTNWFNVKSRLENMTDNFMSYDDYMTICTSENITDKSAQDTLVDFLNDLGVILHFRDFELLGTYILEPKWVTEAVYKIINSEELAKSKGILRLSLLDKILKQTRETDYYYPRYKYRYIIKLMKKFELCYDIDNKTVLIPDLLEVKEPQFTFDYKNSLRFILKYDFLPRSVIPRFIVKMHKDIKENMIWRTGVVLKDEDFQSTAVIRADERDKKIYIYVIGEQKRDYFATIRKTFADINNSFEKLSVTGLVPLPGHEDIAVEYDELIGYELDGRDEFFIGKLRKSYSVTELLNGVEKNEHRKQKTASRVIVVKHGDYYEKPDMEVTKLKQEKVIKIGPNVKISAPVVIADTIENSFNTLRKSTVDDKLKRLLDELLKEINEVNKKVPQDATDDAEAMVRDADALVKEAVSPKPRRRSYEVNIENLKQAAIYIGEIANPVLDIVKKLIPLLLP